MSLQRAFVSALREPPIDLMPDFCNRRGEPKSFRSQPLLVLCLLRLELVQTTQRT
jgi:hypothetical protein